MVIHPPMLYLGYVGFSVPFAFALGALMMRYPGEKWIKITRVWTMVTWLFLTCGIFLGMHWAYAVLGWGGYWGWDPVENASFMPWLTGTAFLHSVMMQEKKGMMKSWNVWLIFSTFLLTLLGTLLTRAGLVSSVHAFAQSSIGTWFMVFMGIVLAVCIFTYVLQRDHLKGEHISNRWSAANPASSSTILCCSPPASSSSGERSSRSSANTSSATRSPWARRFITASPFPSDCSCCSSPASGRCCPGAPLRFETFAATSLLPVIALWATVIVCFAVGVESAARTNQFDSGNFYALVAFALSAAVFTAILSEFFRGARSSPARPAGICSPPRICSPAATPAATVATSSTSAWSSSSSAWRARHSTPARKANWPSTTSWSSAPTPSSGSASRRTPTPTTTPNAPCSTSTRTAKSSSR